MLQSRIGLKVRAILFAITLFFLLGHIFVSIITHDIPGAQAKHDFEQDLNSMGSFGLDIEDAAPSEIGMENGKRFKLYEKKRLTHDKAKKFCKKREGQLAQAKNIDEMRRLQSLLMKARLVGGDIWVGADKKEWKKYSSKMNSRMNQLDLGPQAMMLGGGPTEMCPGLSSSTRSLTPVECYKELPFVCEYEPGKGKVKVKDKGKDKKTTTTGKKESQTASQQQQQQHKSPNRFKMPKRDEMKRRKREIVKLPQADKVSIELSTKEPTTAAVPMQSTSSDLPSALTLETLTLGSSSEKAVTVTLNEIETSTLSTPVVESELKAQMKSGSESSFDITDESTSTSHYIGFSPHVVHVERDKEAKERLGHKSRIGDAMSVNVKLSTKLMLAQESAPIEELDYNSISFPSTTATASVNENPQNEPTLIANTRQLTSDSDPDQAMVDLINEQSELQSLESMLIDFGMNLSIEAMQKGGTTSSSAMDLKSFGHDDNLGTASSMVEGRSNDVVAGESNVTETETASTDTAVGTDRYKSKPDKRAGKGMVFAANVTSELVGSSPLLKHLVTPTTTVTIDEENATHSYSDKQHESDKKFQEEPLAKNPSLSLLEPKITIELTSREGKDNNMHHNANHPNGTTTGASMAMATPSPLLSPLSNTSAQSGNEPRPAPVTREAVSGSTNRTTPPMQTTRTLSSSSAATSTTQKMSTIATAEIKGTTRSNIIERSIMTSATTPLSRSTSMKSPTQETQETTSANTPFTSAPSTPSLTELLAPKDLGRSSTKPAMENAGTTNSYFQISTERNLPSVAGAGEEQKDESQRTTTISTPTLSTST